MKNESPVNGNNPPFDNMRTTLKLVKGAALLLLLSTLNPQSSTLFAQGTAFTYQGRLNDNGSPPNRNAASFIVQEPIRTQRLCDGCRLETDFI